MPCRSSRGSGVTAAHNILAMRVAGTANKAVKIFALRDSFLFE